jgi:L-fuconolactonase
MFGSDWPVANLGGTYSQIVELAEALTSGLSPTESEFFWHKTAASAYGIAQ